MANDYAPVIAPDDEYIVNRRMASANRLNSPDVDTSVSLPAQKQGEYTGVALDTSPNPDFGSAFTNTYGPAPQWKDYAPVEPKSTLGKVGQGVENYFTGIPQQKFNNRVKAFDEASEGYQSAFNRELQTQQEQRAKSTAESEQGLREAQAKKLNEQGQMNYIPDGNGGFIAVPVGNSAPVAAATVRGNSAENVQGEKNTGALAVQGSKNAGAQQLESQRSEDKLAQIKSTYAYKVQEDMTNNKVKEDIAQMQAGKAPAAMVQAAGYAQGGLKSLDDATNIMTSLENNGAMGQNWAQDKLENWIFGKGMVDPNLPPEVRTQIGQLRAALGGGVGAFLRAHTGRSAGQMYEDYAQMLGPGQDWAALRGTIQEISGILTQYAEAPGSQNIEAIRSGQGANFTPPATVAPKTKAPPVGTVEGGYKFKGGNPNDSKNWEIVKKGAK